MKILHAIDTLQCGGAERLLVMLLPQMVRMGHQVTVAVRCGPYDLEDQLLAGGVRVVRLPGGNRWNLIGGARALASTMPDADVVHSHLYFPSIYTSLAKILGFTKAKTCVTFHNLAYAGATRASWGLSFRRLIASSLHTRGMTGCLAVSTAVAETVRRALGLADIKVIPNPVDLAQLRSIALDVRARSATGAACTVVLPGRIVREKGHADLLDALVLLAKEDALPSIVIAGDGPLRLAVSEQAERFGLRDRIKFTGALAHAELMAIIASSDVVVIPSRFEGFGLVALEAMALARSIVASDAGGLPETIGDAGLIVRAGDSRALATAIRTLCADPVMRGHLGKIAKDRAGLFDLPAIAQRHVDFYRSLLN